MYSIKPYEINGKTITVIDVEQENISCTFMDYGAAILSIVVPDQDGNMESVVMAYDNLADYIENKRHLNATIGPTAGRIQNATFTIDNHTITLDKNMDDTHNLHGGRDALSYSFFKYSIREESDQSVVTFTLTKQSNAQHYPGNQRYVIIYTVKPGKLEIEFLAETDQPTLVNLTNHAYFNLSGSMKRTILSHLVQIHASNYMTLQGMIPIGIEPVSPQYDRQTLQTVFQNPWEGLDHPYILDEVSLDKIQATLIDPISKRRLDVYTSYPCIVCYTDNVPMPYKLLFGAENKQHMGICFETQNPPNGIHVEGCVDSILRPKEDYYHKTIFAFSVEESS
jgi:aldose 1-epimerase